jgi:hypothetical protein
MAERLKDKEDKVLESLFASEPVPDNGFSASVMSRLRRRLWLRRLTLPAAFLIGAAIALKPLSQLAITFSRLLEILSADVGGPSIDAIPQSTTFLLGALLLVAVIMITKLLED